jgi:integrase
VAKRTDRISKMPGRELWRARYTVQTATGPKRKTIYGKTYEECRKALTEAMANADRGLTFDAGALTVGKYLVGWLKDIQGTVRQSTFERYASIVTNHITPGLGSIKLARLNPNVVRQLYRDKSKNLSPRSVNYIHVTLHKALRAAVTDGLIPRNVCDAVKAPQPHRPEITPFTPEQVRALLTGASGERYEALFVLAIHTGMRRGELLALRWSDTDLDAGKLHVRRSLSPKGVFSPPKNGKARTVRLTPTAVHALREHHKRQLEAGDASTLVFVNRAGNPVDPVNLTHRSFKQVLRRAGIEDSFTLHTCRHTFATTLLRANVHPKQVQEALGHSTIKQTLDTYSHLLPDMQERVTDAIEAAF